MQITRFPPSQQNGSSHGGSTMRESSLKHICDSIFCPSAMRNPQIMLAGGLPRDPEEAPKSALRSSSSTATSIFSQQCDFKHRTGATPRTPQDQCCCTVLPSSMHAEMCKQHPHRMQATKQSIHTDRSYWGGPEAELLCQLADTLKAKADV